MGIYYAPSSTGTVNNDAAINAATNGIYVAGNGANVNNSGMGTIKADNYGIYAENAANVSNSGAIEGLTGDRSEAGIVLKNVANAINNGDITAKNGILGENVTRLENNSNLDVTEDGINQSGGSTPGTLINTGNITGANAAGSSGIKFVSDGGSINHTGTITGFDYGVTSGNLASATIKGDITANEVAASITNSNNINISDGTLKAKIGANVTDSSDVVVDSAIVASETGAVITNNTSSTFNGNITSGNIGIAGDNSGIVNVNNNTITAKTGINIASADTLNINGASVKATENGVILGDAKNLNVTNGSTVTSDKDAIVLSNIDEAILTDSTISGKEVAVNASAGGVKKLYSNSDVTGTKNSFLFDDTDNLLELGTPGTVNGDIDLGGGEDTLDLGAVSRGNGAGSAVINDAIKNMEHLIATTGDWTLNGKTTMTTDGTNNNHSSTAANGNITIGSGGSLSIPVAVNDAINDGSTQQYDRTLTSEDGSNTEKSFGTIAENNVAIGTIQANSLDVQGKIEYFLEDKSYVTGGSEIIVYNGNVQNLVNAQNITPVNVAAGWEGSYVYDEATGKLGFKITTTQNPENVLPPSVTEPIEEIPNGSEVTGRETGNNNIDTGWSFATDIADGFAYGRDRNDCNSSKLTQQEKIKRNCYNRRYSMFTKFRGGFSNFNRNSAQYDETFGTMYLGGAVQWKPDFLTGIYGGYGMGSLKYDYNESTEDYNTFNLGAFALYKPTETSGIIAAINYARISHDLDRHISETLLDGSQLNERAKSHFSQDVYSAGLKAYRDLDWVYGIDVRPSLGLSYTFTDRDAYKEEGAEYGMNVHSLTQDYLTSSLRVDFMKEFKANSQARFGMVWYHQWLENDGTTLNYQFSPNVAFQAPIADYSDDVFELNAGIDWNIKENVRLNAEAFYQYGTGYQQTFGGKLGVTVTY
ncbi:MAG: autotransporter domain-containing protein [Alphaproteobacteria bacterium]